MIRVEANGQECWISEDVLTGALRESMMAFHAQGQEFSFLIYKDQDSDEVVLKVTILPGGTLEIWRTRIGFTMKHVEQLQKQITSLLSKELGEELVKRLSHFATDGPRRKKK